MKSNLSNNDEYIGHEYEFHRAIFVAAKNVVLQTFMEKRTRFLVRRAVCRRYGGWTNAGGSSRDTCSLVEVIGKKVARVPGWHCGGR